VPAPQYHRRAISKVLRRMSTLDVTDSRRSQFHLYSWQPLKINGMIKGGIAGCSGSTRCSIMSPGDLLRASGAVNKPERWPLSPQSINLSGFSGGLKLLVPHFVLNTE
jgi:hypothetical protein